MSDVVSQAAFVLDKFPSDAALQRELAHANNSTISSWRRRGRIPVWQQAAVLEAGLRLGLTINRADFFPSHQAAA